MWAPLFWGKINDSFCLENASKLTPEFFRPTTFLTRKFIKIVLLKLSYKIKCVNFDAFFKIKWLIYFSSKWRRSEAKVLTAQQWHSKITYSKCLFLMNQNIFIWHLANIQTNIIAISNYKLKYLELTSIFWYIILVTNY